MNHLRIKKAALAVAVVGTLAAAALATNAEAAVDARLRVSLPNADITFRTTPRWVAVPGSDVYVVRHEMRPAQDFFRYKKWYYVYDHGTWYRAKKWNGRYVVVRERDLPRAFWGVRRSYWRSYPRHWRSDRDDWRSERRDDRWDNRRDDRWDNRRDERWDDRRDHDRRDDDRRGDGRGTW